MPLVAIRAMSFQDLLPFTGVSEPLDSEAFKDSWYELMLWKPLRSLLVVIRTLEPLR